MAVFAALLFAWGIAAGGHRGAPLRGAEGPEWPLEAEPAVSSNFGEYREGHFHAGVDIRTYGAEGVPCVAAVDGYVSRLRASPEGYGKAIYLRAFSGETLVYAHLAEFDPVLERALYEAQTRAGRYVVDIRFPEGRFPVRRGDVIAWSGSTGGIAPHLHFEVRDAGENPLNPFSNGFALEDRLPPEFETVQFTPLGPEARINGHCWPVELAVDRLDAGRYAVRDTLQLLGGVGMAVEVIDLLNARSGRLAPYRVTLAVDDTVVADVRMERFSFAHTGQVDFFYDISRIRRDKTYFVQLFHNEGETLWNSRFRLRGTLGQPITAGGKDAGAARVGVVRATDAAGNEAVLTFRFYSDASPPLTRRQWEHTPLVDYTDRTDLVGLFVLGPFASAGRPIPGVPPPDNGAFAAVPTDTAGFEGFRRPVVYDVQSLLDGPVAVPSRTPDETVYVIGIEKGRPTWVGFPELQLQLVFTTRTLYDDAVVFAGRWNGVPASGADPSELIARSEPVRVGPYSVVFRADVEIRFEVDGLDSTAAIYRLNERKSIWVFYESTVDRGTVSTTAKRPGIYGVFSDNHGPRIREPIVRSWKSYATGEERPQIVVPIQDTGSGVDHRKTSVFLEGTEQIAYWDIQAKKLFVVVRDPNIMGPRTVTVVAYDQAGNRSQLKSIVDISATP